MMINKGPAGHCQRKMHTKLFLAQTTLGAHLQGGALPAAKLDSYFICAGRDWNSFKVDSPRLHLALPLSLVVVPPFFFFASQATLIHFNLYFLYFIPILAMARPCLFQILSLWILKLFFSQEAWLLK